MPTRNANLNRELNPFILSRIEAGQLENPGRAVRARLRRLERQERVYVERPKNHPLKPDNLSPLRSLPMERLFNSAPGPNAVLEYAIHQRA
jgi:hypothetical protein